MIMLINKKRVCSFPGEHKGRLHAYQSKQIAKVDGTPVRNAPEYEIFICEGHYPDKDDPTFSQCRCRLCMEERLLVDEIIESIDGE